MRDVLNWKTSTCALVAAIVFFAHARVSAAPMIIYVPAEFPDVCAYDLTGERQLCPPGVSGQSAATAICNAGLSRLTGEALRYGVALCGGSSPVPVADPVELVLLVDDRNMSPELRQTLGPAVSGSGRVSRISGVFRNRTSTVVRDMVIVGERSAEAIELRSNPYTVPVIETSSAAGDAAGRDGDADCRSFGADFLCRVPATAGEDAMAALVSRFENDECVVFPEGVTCSNTGTDITDPAGRFLRVNELDCGRCPRTLVCGAAGTPLDKSCWESPANDSVVEGTSPASQGAGSAAALARPHWERGRQLYLDENFSEAAQEFLAAYAIVSEPYLLYDAALAYERDLQYTDAADHFARYLSEIPGAPDADEVRRRIDMLRTRALDQQQYRELGLEYDPDGGQ